MSTAVLIDGVDLYGYEARVCDDTAKTDLELVHDACGVTVCDIEHGDTLDVLVRVVIDHVCPTDSDQHPLAGQPATAGDLRNNDTTNRDTP